MRNLDDLNRIVIKVGTSTLTFENGNLNLKRIEKLVRVISDIKNSGKDVILVTSGAIGVGIGRIGLLSRPTEMKDKQAAAAVGQCRLMRMYDKLFGDYNQIVGQVLITKEVVTNDKMRENTTNTFGALLEFGVIPIVNENDTVATDEILMGGVFGDNDTLSAYVANTVGADLLIMLTDVDGLWDGNKVIIPEVTEINDELKSLAGGAGSNRGTGGMITKIMAAETANAKTIIMKGDDPSLIYDVLGGEEIGTYFNC